MEQELLHQLQQEKVQPQVLLVRHAPGLAPALLHGQVGVPVPEASCGPRYLGCIVYRVRTCPF